MWQRVWLRVRKGKKRTTYCLCWYGGNGGIRTEAVGSDKRLAEEHRRQRESELNSGRFCDTTLIRLGAFAEEHLELVKTQLATGTWTDQRCLLKRFQAFCGDLFLTKVTSRIVEAYFSQRLEGRRPATANKDLRTLKSILGCAVRRGYLTDNPARAVKPVREPEREVRVLSVEEIEKLLAGCECDRLRLFVFMALTTGMRRGELCALEWEDVELEAGLLSVRNHEGHTTKSGRIRRLALVPEAVTMLRDWRTKSFGTRVFEPRNGEDVGNSMIKAFRRLVERTGVDRATLHDLRRSFCSHLAMVGINEAVVQRLAGHSSIKTTERYYTHILPQALREATARLPYAHAGRTIPKPYREGFPPLQAVS
jgi:integrase